MASESVTFETAVFITRMLLALFLVGCAILFIPLFTVFGVVVLFATIIDPHSDRWTRRHRR